MTTESTRGVSHALRLSLDARNKLKVNGKPKADRHAGATCNKLHDSPASTALVPAASVSPTEAASRACQTLHRGESVAPPRARTAPWRNAR